jgi:hypothetical protein
VSIFNSNYVLIQFTYKQISNIHSTSYGNIADKDISTYEYYLMAMASEKDRDDKRYHYDINNRYQHNV